MQKTPENAANILLGQSNSSRVERSRPQHPRRNKKGRNNDDIYAGETLGREQNTVINVEEHLTHKTAAE